MLLLLGMERELNREDVIFETVLLLVLVLLLG